MSLRAVMLSIAVFVGLWAGAAKADAWEVVKHGGRDYVTAQSVKDFYGFTKMTRQGDTVTLENKTVVMKLSVGKRECLMNNVKFIFSYKVESQGTKVLVSRVDLAKLVDPVLRPNYIPDAEIFSTVILDPGDGGENSGATKPDGAENDHTLELARRLKPMLEKRGFKVILTRNSDRHISLKERVIIANRIKKGAIFISLHFNSGDRADRGIETFVLSPEGAAHDGSELLKRDFQSRPGNQRNSANVALATTVHGSALRRLGKNTFDLGIKRAPLSVLTGVRHPAILFKFGFISQPDEARLIGNEAYQNALAYGIVYGTIKYRYAVTSKSARAPAPQERERIDALLLQAKNPGVREIPVNKEQLGILLDSVVSIENAAEREMIYQCLLLAKSSDGTDIDKMIAERTVTPPLATPIRIKLFKVLEMRANPEVLPTLLSFAKKPGDTSPAPITEIAAALKACKKMARDEDFEQFLDVLENADNIKVRNAAETTISRIIDRSENRGNLASLLATAYDKQIDEDRRLTILRLLGRAGGDRTRDIVGKALGSDDSKQQTAAVFAIGVWPNDSMFETLMDYLADSKDPALRLRAFDAARRFLIDPKRERSPEDSEDLWRMLALHAKTDSEMVAVINDAVRQKGDWAIAVIEYFVDTTENDKVIDRAEYALDFIHERDRVRENDGE